MINSYDIYQAIGVVETKYHQLCQAPSDINEHLPVLYKYARQCTSILECGVRGVVSTWALIRGLLHHPEDDRQKNIFLNDKEVCDISELLSVTNRLPIHVDHEWVNDLELVIEKNYDLVFIDTWHIYGQLKRELAKFGPCTNKYIIMHDTEIDGLKGEGARFNWDIEEQSRVSGYSLEEIESGLQQAISEFVSQNPEWRILEQLQNNNGLTVLQRM